MYLIDTSILIDFFKNKHNASVDYFEIIIEKKLPWGITSVIYQEALQGVSSKKDFDLLNNYLVTQKFYHPKDPVLSFQSAAELYFSCRTQGITIHSTIDCLIAQIAIEHDLQLLHNDKDFTYIGKIAKTLNLAEI